MHKFNRLFRKTENVLSSFLYGFAIINIFISFLLNTALYSDAVFLYTRFSIAVLALFIILGTINKGFNLGQIVSIFPDVFFIAIGLAVKDTERVFQFYLLGRQTFRFVRDLAIKQKHGKVFESLSQNPPVLVLISFIFAIFTGTLLLMLPAATVIGKQTSALGALFTSASATCVTGLIVYDTGTHFTMFGQSIILFLLQIGGLGIMTVSSAFAVILRQRLTVRSQNLIQNVVGETNTIDMVRLIRSIVMVTFMFELLGALLLFFTFNSEFTSTGTAVYHSVFHSVSAFCNAGFSLYQDSFIGFRTNFNINFVITSLIIIGGIGFPVLVDLNKNIFNKFKLSRLTLHSKIVILMTLGLLLLGMIGFFIAEYNVQMKEFSLSERLYASYFQSVTTRTAGFNTIDNAGLSKASSFISNLFMFIGASPGSTGGGLKTTTLMIVLISVWSMFKGEKDVNIFKRKVSELVIKKVLALIAASIAVISLVIFVLLIIEPFSFEKIIFEAFSAFGTVGLSMGITAQLSNVGKMLIIMLMYLGRVGPLTLIFAISESRTKTNFSFTEEKISIG